MCYFYNSIMHLCIHVCIQKGQTHKAVHLHDQPQQIFQDPSVHPPAKIKGADSSVIDHALLCAGR